MNPPRGAAVRDIAVHDIAADRHGLAVDCDAAVQRFLDGGAGGFVFQRFSDFLGRLHRGDQQRHRVGAIAARMGQAPVQGSAGHGQHILVQGTVGLAVQLGKLAAIVGFTDGVSCCQLIGVGGVLPDIIVPTILPHNHIIFIIGRGRIGNFNKTALGTIAPAAACGGRVPVNAAVGCRIRGLQKVAAAFCAWVEEAVVLAALAADHRVLKAAVLQLHVVAYLGFGLPSAAAGGNFHPVVVAVGIGGGGVALAGQQGIQRSVQRVGTFGGQVLIRTVDGLARDLLPAAGRTGLAAVPGVGHAVHRVALAVDDSHQFAGGCDIIPDFHAAQRYRLQGRLVLGIGRVGAFRRGGGGRGGCRRGQFVLRCALPCRVRILRAGRRGCGLRRGGGLTGGDLGM